MTRMPQRRQLPNRRGAETQELVIGGMTLTATVGFDATGNAAEVFLSGANFSTKE